MSTGKSDSIIVLPQTPQLVGLYTYVYLCLDGYFISYTNKTHPYWIS